MTRWVGLKVAPAVKDDVGQNIVRLDRRSRKKLGVDMYDAVESLLNYVEEEISEIGVEELLRPIYKIVEERKTPADQQREIFINEGLEKLCSDLMRRTKWEL